MLSIDFCTFPCKMLELWEMVGENEVETFIWIHFFFFYKYAPYSACRVSTYKSLSSLNPEIRCAII